MGILPACGTAKAAPHHFTSDGGAVSWGGTRVACLTANDLLDILEFCATEASRRSHHDERQGLAKQESEASLFHPDFMHGYSHTWWTTFDAGGRTVSPREQQGEEFFAQIRMKS